MTMIAIGGIIGAGLFVGTGPILNQAGPVTILTYLLTGTILILVMRMLGEMGWRSLGRLLLRLQPHGSGKLGRFLRRVALLVLLGDSGRLRGHQAAGILGEYIPGIPPWLISLFLILLLTATNLYSVGSYGEFEFWFAGIKVAAIIIFIVLAILFVTGVLPGGGMGLSNLYAHGGFFPNGGLVMFSGVVTVIFAFVGAEIVTIAASESNEPERGVARATNQVIYRTLFHVGSVFFLAAVVPWDNQVLRRRGTPEPVYHRFPEDGDTLRARYHELRGPDRRAQRSQLEPLHDLPDALRAHEAQRRAGVLHRYHPPRRPDVGDPRGTSFAYISVVIYYFFPEEIFTWLINARAPSRRLPSDRHL